MYSLIKSLLKKENNGNSDTKLIKLSKIKFDQLKSYIGQEAYNKDGKVIGLIKRIIAINGSKALYVEINVKEGSRKKLKASRIYVLVKEVNSMSNASIGMTNISSDKLNPSCNQVIIYPDKLIRKLSLINSSEIEIDMKYAQGLISYETYAKVKRDIINERICLVKECLGQIESNLDSLRINNVSRKLIMALLTCAKIYLFERDSVSRQS